MNIPCSEIKLSSGGWICVCGTDPSKPWETPNWCNIQVRLNAPLVEQTKAERAVSEYKDRLVYKIKHACQNIAPLEHFLIGLIYS
jgi:hypothetical protein